MGRKRGIRASRPKLEMAMLAAGIRSQNELAERMAELEGLVFPPRDTVSRAFRGIRISPTSLARIARVLGVAPDQLCEAVSDTEDKGTALSGVPSDEPPLGCISITIHCPDDEARGFAQALLEDLTVPLRAILLDPALAGSPSTPSDLASRFQSDAVVTIHCLKLGRQRGLRVFFYHHGVDRLIWTGCLPNIRLKQRPDEPARSCQPYLLAACNGTAPDEPCLSAEDQERYLQARDLLDNQPNENDLRHAQFLLNRCLESAGRQNLLYAALAETLVGLSWLDNERELLVKAENLLRSLPDSDSLSIRARSSLLVRTGRGDQAIRLCRKQLQQQPDDIEFITALGNTLITVYQQYPEQYPAALEEAIDLLTRACELEPDFWRHFFDLGNALFSAHRRREALQSFERAAQLRPTPAAFLNLGNLQLCQGEIEQALNSYRQAAQMSPDSHQAGEFLGIAHYYLGEYQQAVLCYRQTLDALDKGHTAGIHQMWGGLADALRRQGDWKQAVEAYSKALEILERDRLRGYAMVMDEIYHDYYLYALHHIDPERFARPDTRITRERFAEYLERDLYPSAYLRLAQLERMEGRLSRARQARDKAVAICPGYRLHPDMKPLAESGQGEISPAPQDAGRE